MGPMLNVENLEETPRKSGFSENDYDEEQQFMDALVPLQVPRQLLDRNNNAIIGINMHQDMLSHRSSGRFSSPDRNFEKDPTNHKDRKFGGRLLDTSGTSFRQNGQVSIVMSLHDESIQPDQIYEPGFKIALQMNQNQTFELSSSQVMNKREVEMFDSISRTLTMMNKKQRRADSFDKSKREDRHK